MRRLAVFGGVAVVLGVGTVGEVVGAAAAGRTVLVWIEGPHQAFFLFPAQQNRFALEPDSFILVEFLQEVRGAELDGQEVQLPSVFLLQKKCNQIVPFYCFSGKNATSKAKHAWCYLELFSALVLPICLSYNG